MNGSAKMLVSFSGIDSAGKTTQIKLLEDYCENSGIKTKRIWGKARGTPGVLFLKRILRRDNKMTQEEKLEYRAEVFQNKSKKTFLLVASLLDLLWFFGIYYRIANLFHRIVILDRYVWDTYIEVKTEFTGIDFEKWILWKLVVAVSPKPRVSFLFVIPPEESIRRDIQKEDLTVDSLELKKEKIAFYMELKEKKKWTNVMDGMKTIDSLHKEVLVVLGL